ncbi:MAG: peptide chain release factor 1 [Candidatus Brocadiae bacterium]|nr:peptide chain release factor 1 [Candidatus Brocadiia bacterium]
MVDKLESMRARHAELQESLATPEVASNPDRLRAYSKEFGSLGKFVSRYNGLCQLLDQVGQAQSVLDETNGDDPELRELAPEELDTVTGSIAASEEAIRELVATDDEDTARDAIVEIRAGTGGDEAGLFVADLFRMYQKYAEARGWKLEAMESHPTDLGGFKEITFAVEGDDVFKRLRHESGVHRVQRIPATETSGRRHTSAVTVAVLPAAEEVDVEINPDDLAWDIFRSSGPGGQGVNKTSSAVRLTHAPSGIVVSMQDERSQHKNRAKALRILRSRLYEQRRAQKAEARGELRRSQVGSGDRSERIRTYNFPENRFNDHRINLTIYHLEEIMMGALDQVIDPLLEHEKLQRLSEL